MFTLLTSAFKSEIILQILDLLAASFLKLAVMQEDHLHLKNMSFCK